MNVPKNRFSTRKNGQDKWWTVYDLFTGEPAQVNGIWLTRCEESAAASLADLLNSQHTAARKGTAH